MYTKELIDSCSVTTLKNAAAFHVHITLLLCFFYSTLQKNLSCTAATHDFSCILTLPIHISRWTNTK